MYDHTTLEGEATYCPSCRCSFPAWMKHCPVCRHPLENKQGDSSPFSGAVMPYEQLLSLVESSSGQFDIELSSDEIIASKRWGFPYQGYGFAWAKTFRGRAQDCEIILKTTEVGIHRVFRFPYQGYGFGWMRCLEGHVSGNSLRLTATDVEMRREWSFPYFGFGYGWTQEMSGSCGDRLDARLVATDIGKKKKYAFPYLGYGYAWVNKARLTLSLRA